MKIGSRKTSALVCGLSTIILWSVTFGCASWLAESKRPDWVDGVSSQYPGTRYITGIGFGPDRQVAEDNARAEISKVFVARIQQRSYEFDQYLQIASGGKTEGVRRLDLEQVTSVSTEKLLTGISMADHWVDDASDPPSHYALAVLNRAQAKNSLLEKIDQADQEVMNLTAAARRSKDPLRIIQKLKRAIGELVLREAYNEELRVVNLQGTGKKGPIRLEELKGELADVLKDEFNLAIKVRGPYQAQTMQALTEGLTRLGFIISPNPSQATVMVLGTVRVGPSDIPHPKWNFVRWSVDFQLVDRRDGKIFGSINTSGKEGHLTASEAEKRAVRMMQKELTSQVGQELTDYIFGQ